VNVVEFYKSIDLARNGEIVGQIELDCSVTKQEVSISYVDSFLEKGKKGGPSFFYVLAEIREEYRKKELLLLCKGALLTVFPGGLTSDSSFGELAYEISNAVDDQKVVNVFDSVDITDIKTIASFDQQKKNRREIIRSNGEPRRSR
jgi:hypothetical protein